MARGNFPILSFNRGLISRSALARVDLDRTRLSAEVMTNWLPKTEGPMGLRPGTKHFGSSFADTGAEFLEFVASTEDVALVEVTAGRLRFWQGDDAHSLSLLKRERVDTTVSLSDTGWDDDSTGGALSGSGVDIIPTMTGSTTSGVTMTASDNDNIKGVTGEPWHAADDSNNSAWSNSTAGSPLPGWLNVDFGQGNPKAVFSYSLRAGNSGGTLDNAPSAWRLLGGDHDTGTYATDTGKWTLEDERSSETDWAVGEKRTYELSDTGTPGPWRHWRLYVTDVDGGSSVWLSEIEMFSGQSAEHVTFSSGGLQLNASAIGALAKATKRVIVDTGDVDVEHPLAIRVGRGPVTLRVGSTDGDDDYVSETSLGTGHHNLAFTPGGDFHITLQSNAIVNRIVSSLSIGDSGTVELTAPWQRDNLDNIRYDQSADVAFVDCRGVRPQKIERRGTGNSWSVVDYAPDDGPFLPVRSSSAKLSVSQRYGNTTLSSDIPFFKPTHVGALIRAFHGGQSGQWPLGALGAVTDPIEVTGLLDTGVQENPERRITFSVSGTWAGAITIERSIDGEDQGFKAVPGDFFGSDTGQADDSTDTGTFTATINDQDNNLRVWYRARVSSYTSGVAIVSATYGGGGVTGIARITDYNSNTSVGIEVLSRFSDTGPTDNWQEGYWSETRGFPTAVALHGGRLAHAQGGSLFLTVADDYESFDESVIGEAGPIIKTLGSGPVDAVQFLVSLLRLIIGTAGSELTARSSSLDEPLTPENSQASIPFSTQGAAALRAVKMDTRAIYVQRSGGRLLMAGAGAQGGNALGDYETLDLTLLVPDLLNGGRKRLRVVSIAIQRQPDTRIHCVLSDGTVGILTYEPTEEVVCWTRWESDTGTNPAVERAVCLPGLYEDAVFYHVRRTINGETRRYLEKWAMESETLGDTGLTFLSDCAKAYTDTGRTSTLTGYSHLAGRKVVVWADDTGAASANPWAPDAGKDLSPDVGGVQTTYTVDAGAGTIALNEDVHHAVAGLAYKADWKSSKLAYGAQSGTALAQMKRASRIGFILMNTHNAGVLYGPDSGHLDPLPRMIEEKRVDPDAIFETFEDVSMPFDGIHDADARVHLRAKSPRPATVLALVPTVETKEKV